METEIWLNFGSFAYAFHADLIECRAEEVVVRWAPQLAAYSEPSINGQEERNKGLCDFLHLISAKARSLLLTELRVYLADPIPDNQAPLGPKVLRLLSQLPPSLAIDRSHTIDTIPNVYLSLRYLTPASLADAQLWRRMQDQTWPEPPPKEGRS
jgi:hypothetical protein